MRFLLLATLFFGQVYSAAPVEELLLRGNENLEVGFYDQAKEDYRKLLSRPLESWQQNIVFYNLGTLAVKQGNWWEGVGNFLRADGKNLPPYLKASLNRNLALALIGLANELQREGGGPLAGRLYDFASINFDIDFSLEPQKISKEETPNAAPWLILRQALLKEEKAFLTTLQAAVDKVRGRQDDLVVETAKNQQSATSDTAKMFIPALLTWEKKTYSENRCLQKPFDEVVPLFSQGYHAAEKAGELLENRGALPQALDFQWEAIGVWKMALDNWTKVHQAKEPEMLQATESEKESRLAQKIIEMSVEDKRPEEAGEKKSVKRPW